MDLLTPGRSPNSALPLHTQKQCTARGSSWGSSIPVSDHWRLLDPPWGRVAKPVVSPLTTVPLINTMSWLDAAHLNLNIYCIYQRAMSVSDYRNLGILYQVLTIHPGRRLHCCWCWQCGWDSGQGWDTVRLNCAKKTGVNVELQPQGYCQETAECLASQTAYCRDAGVDVALETGGNCSDMTCLTSLPA